MRVYRRHVIALLAVSVLAHCAVGSTYRVATNGTQITPYTDWSNAFSNIHDAVDYATDGDTLLVSNGLYAITQQIILTNGITLQSANGAEGTIIDAGGNDRCLFVGHPEAMVDGFTLCNGDAADSVPADKGGGIYLEATGTVQNCTIVSNTAEHGAGAYISFDGLIDRCIILDNYGFTYGGGIYFYNEGTVSSGGPAINCLITGTYGGATYSYGGGAFFYYGGQMDSCTVAFNQSRTGGGVQALRGNSTWKNSIIYFNTSTSGEDNWTDNGGGVGDALCTTPTRGTNCQTNDPAFQNAGSGDFRLQPGSPCIDNGQSNGWMATSLDLAGNARIDTVNMANDIGAYEYQIQTLDCGFSADSTEALAPATITFYGTASGTDTNGVSFLWDFDGDGSVDAQGADKGTVSWEYDIGTYTVSLLVTNASGDRAALTNLNYISIGPAVTFVSQAGAHITPYTNWAMASTNLQDAIDECMEGSLVWVEDGRYGLTSEVVVAEGVRVCSINGANSTILDGNDSVRCVYMMPESELDGFTITRGGNGGMYFYYGGTASNCVIVSNAVTGVGGGTRSLAGGMLSHCRVQHNTATSHGGGMYIENAFTVRNCLISDNTSEAWGGGIYLSRGGKVDSCTVTRNEAVTRGGGILHNQGGGIDNSIIYGNTAPLNAERDVYSTSGMYYNYCCTTPSVDAYGSGNITNAPMFKSPSSGDYRLSWTDSPCVDMGDTQLWMSGAVDLDGFERITSDGVDMGAYEARPPSGTVISIR